MDCRAGRLPLARTIQFIQRASAPGSQARRASAGRAANRAPRGLALTLKRVATLGRHEWFMRLPTCGGIEPHPTSSVAISAHATLKATC